MARNPTWVQQDYRFYKDDAVQGSATALANQNTSATYPKQQAFRLVVNVGDTNAATQNNVTAFRLEFSKNAGTWTTVGAATDAQYSSSAYVSDANNYTTQRLNAITGSTYTSAWNEFDTNNTLTSRTWVDNYCEYEFCLQFASGVSVSDSFTFRLYAITPATALTPTNTPTITVASSDVSVGLTGTAPAAQTGTVVPNTDKGISGQVATTAVGSVTTSLDFYAALSGTAVTSSAGTVSVSSDKALVGQVAASAIGALIPAIDRAVSGSEVVSSTGTMITDLPAVRYARPIADLSDGDWLPSTPATELFSMIDEVTASDTDYIYTTGFTPCLIQLEDVQDPLSSSNHVVRYRIYSPNSSSITVRLKQSTTTIASWTHTSIPASYTTHEQTLSAGQADSITDYSLLRLEFEAGS